MPPQPKSLPGLPEDYTSKFFADDVVTKLSDGSYRAFIARCWADEEDTIFPPLAPGQELHPLDRPLLRGEVGLCNVKTRDLSILPEAGFVLVYREFAKGDLVKRSLLNVEAAIVLDIESEVQLEDNITKHRIKQWIPASELCSGVMIDRGCKVFYDEWVGTVEEVFEEGSIQEHSTGKIYRMPERTGFLEVGLTLSELMATTHHYSESQRMPPGPISGEDRVVSVSTQIVSVTWNAINQELPISEQEKHPEPKIFWYGEEVAKLTYYDPNTTPAFRESAIFKDEADEDNYNLPPINTPSSRRNLRSSKRNARAFKVVEIRSKAKLRWQDGTETVDWTTELVPYQNVDDYETWPGEHLVWKGDNGEHRVAVAQSFDPHQRVADVLFLDNQEKASVSVLELDPETYGVDVGDEVLICDDNGLPVPEIPEVGRSDVPMRLSDWQRELAKLIQTFRVDPMKFEMVAPAGEPKGIRWYGEVFKLNLDGTVDVKLPGNDIRRVGIKQLQHLKGIEDPAQPPFQDFMMDMDDDGRDSDEDSWETTSGAENGPSVNQFPDSGVMFFGMGFPGMDIDEDAIERMDIETIDPPMNLVSGPLHFDILPRQAPAAEPTEPEFNDNEANTTAGVKNEDNEGNDDDGDEDDDEKWRSFELLEEAPMDHRFIGEHAGPGSKAFNSRLAKERRALQSSLPDNILVRGYENRTDLMRCLIIGPEGTPYANAPFVFDIYLNPTRFPNDPPVVHFHSHTNGKGRCNPNLYEDGKVCLSILGTWSGDKSESWNPQQSSLLQVLVSISGLVLVRSPYHCEPAFAKLEGTKEGKVNSRLYSEKAYVLSRSFVRTALERPPAGLEMELRHLYLEEGRLKAVIEHARALMAKGQVDQVEEENAAMWNTDAMGSLTRGAILSLERTIEALEKISAEASA